MVIPEKKYGGLRVKAFLLFTGIEKKYTNDHENRKKKYIASYS